MTTVYSIGHSNHEMAAFIELLHQHNIALLADVRSQPYSRYASQFNRETLAHALAAHGIAYRHMGNTLGGRPTDDKLLFPDNSVDYDKLRQNEGFALGLDELLALAESQPTVIMCSEGDHHSCHRHLLITPALLARNVTVLHIQPDGTLINAATEPRQLTLF
jgi:uncharacterized protein (DUF488 family)